jgi:hypothetical protein
MILRVCDCHEVVAEMCEGDVEPICVDGFSINDLFFAASNSCCNFPYSYRFHATHIAAR